MAETSNSLDRRLLLSRGLAALSTSFGAGMNANANVSGRLPLDGLHLHAARRAKDLVGGRSVTLRLLMPQGCEANVSPVVAEFEQMTGVKVDIDWVDVDRINDRLMLYFMTDQQQHDVVLPASFALPDLAATGILLNLTPFAERHEPLDLHDDEIYSVANDYRGAPYGFQTDGDVYVMFYNRPWLENADNGKRFADRHGYPLKTATTWPELDAQMAFFHDPDNQRYGGTLFRNPDYLAWEWWLRFHAKGGIPATEQFFPAINSDMGVDALIELISATRFQHHESKSAGLFRNWELYETGQVFANIGWGGTQKYLNRAASPMRDNLAFGLIPGDSTTRGSLPMSYFNWGWEYAVSAHAKEPELAYLFTLFASSPAMSTLAVSGRDGFFDPYRREHYENEIIREIYSEAFLDVHRRSMEIAIPDFYMRGHSDYMASLKTSIYRALNAELTAKQALDNAAKEWRLISAEHGIEDQRRQWRYIRSHYPQS